MINQFKQIPKIYLLALVAVAAGFTSFAVWLPRYTTSNSEFCLRCHGDRGGLPNRGIQSKIHPSYEQVPCVDCHSKPHQIVYEGYINGFMAETDRVTPNCMLCHPEIATKNDTLGFKYNIYKIGIPHKLHLSLGANCTDCHPNIAHDLNDIPTNRPRMEYCSQCHATSVEPCAKCHLEKPPAGKFVTTYPAGLVGDGKSYYDKNCSSCHGYNGSGVEGINLRGKELFEKYDLVSLRKKTLEGHVNMPPFDIHKGGSLTEDEVRAVIAYLKLSSNGSQTNGQALYESYCAVCHGSKGSKISMTDLSSQEYAKTLNYESLIEFLRMGRKGSHAFDKPYGGPLSYESIVAIARYIPSLSQPATDTATAAKALSDAFKLYQTNCMECHGQKGTDITGVSLLSGNYLKSLGDRRFVKSIAEGTESMPAFAKSTGGSLTSVEINSILNYLKSKAGIATGDMTDLEKTLRVKAPKIPHEVTKDMEDCLECHGSGGIKPFPKDHSGRTVNMCKSCHKPE